MKLEGLDKWIEGDPGKGLDPVEDGQAECHKCGEWYRITAPFIPHVCAPRAGGWGCTCTDRTCRACDPDENDRWEPR